MANFNKKFTIEYFRDLVALAMADGILKDEEKEFFSDKAKEFGFSVDKIEEMFASNDDAINYPNDIEIDENDFITDLVAMTMVDGEIHQNEYELCLKLAERKGFTKNDIDKTINQLQNLLKKDQ